MPMIVDEYQRNSCVCWPWKYPGKCGSRDIPVESSYRWQTTKLEEIAGMGVNSTSTRQISEIGQEVVARHTRLLENGGTSVVIPPALKEWTILWAALWGRGRHCPRPNLSRQNGYFSFMAVQIALQKYRYTSFLWRWAWNSHTAESWCPCRTISPENCVCTDFTETEIAGKSLNEDHAAETAHLHRLHCSGTPEDIRAKVKLARKRKTMWLPDSDHINQLDTGHARREPGYITGPCHETHQRPGSRRKHPCT